MSVPVTQPYGVVESPFQNPKPDRFAAGENAAPLAPAVRKMLHVLIVDDSEDDAQLLILELRHGPWTVIHERVDTREGMTVALDAQTWDAIIADYSMPCFSGLAALAIARERSTHIPFFLVSGHLGEETAVQAMQSGADDYLFKGNLKRLVPALERELRDAEGRSTAEHTARQLQKGERQLADAQRLAHLGTWHADLRTGLAFWSIEARRILGRQEGTTFHEFLGCLHHDDRALITASLDSSDQIIARDCRIVCPNAAVQFVHLRAEIGRDLNNKAIEAAGMIQDITERHLVDAQLREAKDAAVAANRAKTEFLANMSHEIRTPISAIIGFALMLSVKSPEECAQIGCVEIIRRNSLHLLQLIDQILDVSMIEAGQIKVELVSCNLRELVFDVSSLVRPWAFEKSLGFEIAFLGPFPELIRTDPLRLKQILINLLGNAVKFTEAGRIDVCITDEGAGGSAILPCVEISDSGLGILPEQLEQLFMPFAQADASTTRKFGGTGLGLTISRQLAKLLGGNVTASSKPGEGSTFTLRIHGGPAAVAEAPPVKKSGAGLRLHGHILLVEDGFDNQQLFQLHLRNAGASVTSALNGQIAVDLAAIQKFDLILMDMQMPVLDGYSATAELRRRGLQTPIIALTAHAMPEDRANCLACGCTDYLSKPVELETFLSTINRYLPQSISAF